ncbi:nucleotidyltransferase [Virgibacillus kekensis]|uniref:tRNA(Met) cytidine acetate ligase n=1 Tax=Virgibacillus kekensis TaxID=202261 RepID=A0ABV9DF42_9BACI
MDACGLIVEYNPFHNGHVYHLQQAKKVSGADCMIAVMSGSFLQRGEPAIIDKFHRTKAALATGIDIVVELPYPYAVQSSDMFAKGSVLTLNRIGVSSICFGSESGEISHFTRSCQTFRDKEIIYKETLHNNLDEGISFPEASKDAYQKIGLTSADMDLSKPNNILGFSYVKTILDYKLPINPLTIKRTKSGYHDQDITGSIASATSIRKKLFAAGTLTDEIKSALPEETIHQLNTYRTSASTWHTWEYYFDLLQYRVLTMPADVLASIHGVDEGLEHRIRKTAREATTFQEWMEKLKTKRYTWTRLQRTFVHILTNTTKNDVMYAKDISHVPYVRLLGMTKIGQAYLNKQKKQMDVPLISGLNRSMDSMLHLEERASNAYYSILPPKKRNLFHRQELQPPIIIEK